MEAKGVIQQYTVVLDEKQLGNDLTVFISVRLEHPKYGKEFAEAAYAITMWRSAIISREMWIIC